MTVRKFKSDAFEAIHSAASALHEAGTIDKATMRSFDKDSRALAVRHSDGSVRTFSKATLQQVRTSPTKKYGREGVAELSIQEIRTPAAVAHLSRKLAAD